MGGLIQTKGTLLLMKFFSNTFTAANINAMSAASAASAAVVTGFKADFAARYSVRSLHYISEKYRAQNPDGSDVFYPTASVLNSVQPPAAGHLNVLPFVNALPSWANPVGSFTTPGLANKAISNETHPATIPAGTTVTAVSVAANTVTTSVNVPNVQANDTIVFSDPSNPNLIKRWKWYLQHDLTNDNHRAIQDAINQFLYDSTFYQAMFQTIESDTQKVFSSVEYPLNGSVLNAAQKTMNIVLQTAYTTAPDPLDPQF